jgi:hypothetical protein
MTGATSGCCTCSVINLVGDTVDDVAEAAERGVQRIQIPHPAISFLRYWGLSLW